MTDIIRGNCIISEGLKESRTWETLKGKTRLYYNPVHNTVNCEAGELKYHSSWNWLIPAIEKIREDMGHTLYETVFLELGEEYGSSRRAGKKQTIAHVWESVVKYFESKKV